MKTRRVSGGAFDTLYDIRHDKIIENVKRRRSRAQRSQSRANLSRSYLPPIPDSPKKRKLGKRLGTSFG